MGGKRKTTTKKTSSTLPRIVCVVGPTASGKTALAIRLASQYSGEIINADARQCYRDFIIGTGTPPGKRKKIGSRSAYMVEGIPHYLMSFLDPTHVLTAAEWQEAAVRAVTGIVRRKHLPVVVGGAGLYVKALVDNYAFPKVPPKPELREAFQKKPLSELVALLRKVDPAAAEIVDLKNPRRVIRALEVVTFTGESFVSHRGTNPPVVDAFQVGIKWARADLYERIDSNVEEMVERGWIDEIRENLKNGIPEDAPAMTSIGYRELLSYIRGDQSLDDAIAACKKAVRGYAKRQETWYKRDPRIHWAENEDEAFGLAAAWLSELK